MSAMREELAALDECARCRRPMSRTQLAHRREPGTRYHYAKGLCGICYLTSRYIGGTRGKCGAYTEEADEIVIERCMNGERLAWNLAERQEVVRRLTDQGRSAAEIARITGLAARSVCRIRARLRESTPVRKPVDGEGAKVIPIRKKGAA